jgi:hypothetical protein
MIWSGKMRILRLAALIALSIGGPTSAVAQSQSGDKTIEFPAADQDAATSAAFAWAGDSSKHDPINMKSLTVIPREGKFVAVVIYSEMK